MVIPPIFRGNDKAIEALRLADLYTKNAYYELVNETDASDVSITLKRKRVREAARAVLPNMTETQIVVTANHRALLEFFAKRGNIHADLEIRELACRMFTIAKDVAPNIYQSLETFNDVDGYESIYENT